MKKKATTKRLLALVAIMMTACMLLLSFPVSANTTTTADTWDGTYNRSALSGEGTEAKPFIIDSAEKLMGLAKNVICSSDTDVAKRDGGAWSKNNARVSKYYELTVDIDFGGQAIMPIGVAGHSFAGVFDGNGHTIKNFTMQTEVTATKPNGEVITTKGTNGVINLSSHQALFGFSNNDSTAIPAIKNLTVTGATYTTGAKQAGIVSQVRGTLVIDNCHVSNITWANTATYMGGIVADGGATSLTVTNCTSNISANASLLNNDIRVGGIVATGASTTVIENCSTTVGTMNITATNGKSVYVSGILGYMTGNLTINNCRVTGNSINVENALFLGGILASNATMTMNQTTNKITNCYTDINLSCTSADAVGGIAALTRGELEIANCVAVGDITVTDDDSTMCIGGILGQNEAVVSGTTYDETSRSIKNSMYMGTLTVTNTSTTGGNMANVGGLAGRFLNGPLVDNCGMYGTVIISFTDSFSHRSGIFLGGFGYNNLPEKNNFKGAITNSTCAVPVGTIIPVAGGANPVGSKGALNAIGTYNLADISGLNLFNPSDVALADMAVKAVQESDVYEHTLTDNSKVNVMNVRFVANLGVAGDADTDVLTKYNKVGFVITAVHGTNVQDFSQDVNYVYSSINENTSTGISAINADDARIGGDYIVGIEGKLIPATGTVTFYVTPKLVAIDGTVSFGQTATIVYVNGVLQSSAN